VAVAMEVATAPSSSSSGPVGAGGPMMGGGAGDDDDDGDRDKKYAWKGNLAKLICVSAGE